MPTPRGCPRGPRKGEVHAGQHHVLLPLRNLAILHVHKERSRACNPAATGASPACTFRRCPSRTFPASFMDSPPRSSLCGVPHATPSWNGGKENGAAPAHFHCAEISPSPSTGSPAAWTMCVAGRGGHRERKTPNARPCTGSNTGAGPDSGGRWAGPWQRRPLWTCGQTQKSGPLSPFPCTAGSNVDGGTTKVDCSRKDGAP